MVSMVEEAIELVFKWWLRWSSVIKGSMRWWNWCVYFDVYVYIMSAILQMDVYISGYICHWPILKKASTKTIWKHNSASAPRGVSIWHLISSFQPNKSCLNNVSFIGMCIKLSVCKLYRFNDIHLGQHSPADLSSNWLHQGKTHLCIYIYIYATSYIHV